MSKGGRIPDVERTATMFDLIRRQHENDQRGMSLSSVVLEEVAPGVGWSGAVRWADVLVLGIWKSKGQRLDGYEIKASRADLKKELSDLTKHQATARYCDSWTLIAWDDSVLVDGIPESWGIMTTRADEYGTRSLVTKRKPARLTPEPWPKSFVCSLVRNAHQQSPAAAFVGRAIHEAHAHIQRDKRDAQKLATRAALRPIAKLIYGENDWRWPADAFDPHHLAEALAAKLAQGVLAQEVA